MPKRRRSKARGEAADGSSAAAAAAAPPSASASAATKKQPPKASKGKAGKDATVTESAAVAAELDRLRHEALAAARPATAEEEEAVATGSWTRKGIRMRREAEALQILSDRINSAELRAQLGPRWAGVAAALDAALLDAAFGDPYSEDDRNYSGNNSMLRGYLEGRPAEAAARVGSSLGCAGKLDVDARQAMNSLLQHFQGDPAKMEDLRRLTSGMMPATSTQRPPLSSPLSRFDASYAGPGAGAGAGSCAVAEARCEVTTEEKPSAGRVCAAGDYLAFVGGRGWKQREPMLQAGRISSADIHLVDVTTGFFDTGFSVALDPSRGLVWSSGGENRTKAFTIGNSSHSSCCYTLDGGPLLGMLGGRVYASHGAGKLSYWDIDRLTPQGEWIEAGELSDFDEEDEEGNPVEHLHNGVRVRNCLGESWNDEAAAAEATAGDRPHGSIQLLPGALPSTPEQRVPLQLLALGPEPESGAAPQQAAVLFRGSGSLWVYDWPTASLSALLTGFMGCLNAASVCPQLPHLVAAGSKDSTARVWDLRSHACTHLLASRSSLRIGALALADDQGQPFCFTSNAGAESVLCFDLRMRRCLYELATGNTNVCSLQWHSPSRSLFAVGECDYIDRHGHDYEYGAMGGYSWPKCIHSPTDFSYPWDAHSHVLVRYAFRDSPNPRVLPPEAELDEDASEYSDSEEEAEAAKTWRPRERDYW